MSKYSALQIRTDLSFDEPGDGRTLPPRPSQKRLDLLTNDLVQKRLFGLVAFVSDGDKESIGIMGWSAVLKALYTRKQATCRGDCDARLVKSTNRAVDSDAEPTRSHMQRDHMDSRPLAVS